MAKRNFTQPQNEESGPDSGIHIEAGLAVKLDAVHALVNCIECAVRDDEIPPVKEIISLSLLAVSDMLSDACEIARKLEGRTP